MRGANTALPFLEALFAPDVEQLRPMPKCMTFFGDKPTVRAEGMVRRRMMPKQFNHF